MEKLMALAIEAMGHAYVPYSGYKVGAALLCKDGSVYQGCNIENASYSPTVCAERTAFFKAVYDGHRDFAAIAVCGGKNGLHVAVSILPALAALLQRKHYYFVPFGQDDSFKKPASLKSDFSLIPDTLECALRGVQLQPVLL